MKHFVYIHPILIDVDFTLDTLVEDSKANPKKFLWNCRKQEDMDVYDSAEALADAFNEGKISDEGYLLVVEDIVTEKDLDLESIRIAMLAHGIEDPMAPGVTMLDVAPCDFYDGMEEDPFAVIGKKLGYDGIDIPAMDDDGYLHNTYLMQIRLVKQKPGERRLLFVTKNENMEFVLESQFLYAETVARIRELLLGTFGKKEYAWLALYNSVTRHGASEGIRRAAVQLHTEVKPCVLFEGNLSSGVDTDAIAAGKIREALCDPEKDSEKVITTYLK